MTFVIEFNTVNVAHYWKYCTKPSYVYSLIAFISPILSIMCNGLTIPGLSSSLYIP